MSNKTKITLSLDKIKPKNTAVLALKEVRGGFHEKTYKAKRKLAKQNFQKALDYSAFSYFLLLA